MSFARHSAFSVNVFSDHSIILRNLSERRDGRVLRLLVNRFFSYPTQVGYFSYLGPPPSCKQTLNVTICYSQLINK